MIEPALHRSSGDRFHIEHLWANHHHRVAQEIPDAVIFRSRRNQLGGLGLLMGRESSSINDLPLHEKSPLYARSNVLLGIIAPGYDRRNPILREFIKTHRLDKTLRPFGPQETMTSVVQTRQALYLRLFEHIWNPEHLGLPASSQNEQTHPGEPTAAQAHPAAARRRPAASRRRTDVAKMIDSQILKPGTQIVLTYRSTDHWATIDESGGIILNATGGTPYGRVDEAGAVARGTKTCQGMNEWHIEDAVGTRISLRTLRDRSSASSAPVAAPTDVRHGSTVHSSWVYDRNPVQPARKNLESVVSHPPSPHICRGVYGCDLNDGSTPQQTLEVGRWRFSVRCWSLPWFWCPALPG